MKNLTIVIDTDITTNKLSGIYNQSNEVNNISLLGYFEFKDHKSLKITINKHPTRLYNLVFKSEKNNDIITFNNCTIKYTEHLFSFNTNEYGSAKLISQN